MVPTRTTETMIRWMKDKVRRTTQERKGKRLGIKLRSPTQVGAPRAGAPRVEVHRAGALRVGTLVDGSPEPSQEVAHGKADSSPRLNQWSTVVPRG